MKRATEPLLNALAVLSLLLALLSPYRHGAPGRVLDAALGISDFGAFYCAATIARQGGDPYFYAPLRDCEIRRVYGPGGTSYAERGIDPAPLPAYDLALLAPLTFLPYRIAGLLWTVLLVGATLAGAALIGRLASLPFWLVLAALAFANGSACFAYGQEQPVVTLALAGAAALLRAGRPTPAALAASVAWIEPHVALPVILALLIWQPPMRPALLAGIAVPALLALGFAGPAANLEYLTRVLPAHAFAEITVNFQYSLTSLLYTLGLPGGLALRLASVQYAAFAVLGAALAGPLARRAGSPMLLFFPALCAVTGGPFIHITQIASALPFGLYLAGRSAPFARPAWLGTILVALPWPAYGGTYGLLASDALALGGAIFTVFRSTPVALRSLAAAGAFAAYLATGPALRRLPADDLRALEAPSSVAAAGFDRRLASTEYGFEMRRHDAVDESSARRLAQRIPAWAGLLVLCGTALGALRLPKA